jgi:hypothetical protein
MWATFATSALLGSLLLIAGGAKLDICSKLPLKLHVAAGACSAGPMAMMVIGAFVLLGTIPSLLFFSGCAQGPPQTRYREVRFLQECFCSAYRIAEQHQMSGCVDSAQRVAAIEFLATYTRTS